MGDVRKMIPNHVKLWRKETGDALEIRWLTQYEKSVCEGVRLIHSSRDEDRSSSGMVKDTLGAEASRQWFDSRIQELVKDGFTIIKIPAYDPTDCWVD